MRHRHRGICQRREFPQGDRAAIAGPRLSRCRAGFRRCDRIRRCARQARLFRIRAAHEQPRLRGAGARQDRRRASTGCRCCRCSRSRSTRPRSSDHAAAQARPRGVAGGAGRARAKRSRTDGSNSGSSRRSTCARSSSPASRAFARCRHPQHGILLPGAFMPGATDVEIAGAVGARDHERAEGGAAICQARDQHAVRRQHPGRMRW